MSPTFAHAWHVHTDDLSPMEQPSVVGNAGTVADDEAGDAVSAGAMRCTCGVRLFAGAGATYTHEHQNGSGQLERTGGKRLQGGVELEDWKCSCGESFAIGAA